MSFWGKFFSDIKPQTNKSRCLYELDKLARKGIDVLGVQIDGDVVAAWQTYLYSVLKAVDVALNKNYLYACLKMDVKNRRKPLYEVVKDEVEFLINTMKSLKQERQW